jgi:hypothetical protein
VSKLISTDKTWDRVAEMLFPNEPVRGLTERDAWLVNRYRDPAPSEAEYLVHPFDSRAAPPKELIAEIDRAYFRLSLQQKVEAWFEAEGFDVSSDFCRG